MEVVARDEMYVIDTGCEIIGFTPGSINRDTLTEMSFDEIDAWPGEPWPQTVSVTTKCYISLRRRHPGVNRNTGVVADPNGAEL